MKKSIWLSNEGHNIFYVKRYMVNLMLEIE